MRKFCGLRMIGALVAGLMALHSGARCEAGESAFTLDRWIDRLNASKTTTLEGALALLPEEVRQNTVLAYRSMSAQSATEERPRAIVFNRDASFVAAFTGDVYQARGDSIEILQFDPKSEKFEMFSLDFPLERDSKGRIQRPERNPPVCLGCHQPDPRPIFDLAPEWPGFYGSQNDRLAPEERDGYLRYLQTAHAHPRYKHLAPLPRFLNRAFLVRLFELQSRRAISMVRGAPHYRKYRDFLLHSLMDCDRAPDWKMNLGDAYARIEAEVVRDWWAEAGMVPLNIGTWPRPMNFLAGILRLDEREFSLEFVSTDCTNTDHGGHATSGCIGRKVDGQESMADRLASMIRDELKAPTLTCADVQARLRAQWRARP